MHLLLSLLVCLGAITALTGRWPLGAGVAVWGSLGTALQWVVAAPASDERAVVPAAALLTAAVVLGCPPDRRGDRRMSAAAGAMAAVAWFPPVVVGTRAFAVTTDYGAWPMLVLAVTGAALAVRARSSGLRELGALAVASPPLAAYACTNAWGELRPVLEILLLLPVVAALTACFHPVRRQR